MLKKVINKNFFSGIVSGVMILSNVGMRNILATYLAPCQELS